MNYKDLNPKAQEVARNWYIEAFADVHQELVTESFKEKLEELGLPTDNIQWRLSHCQGDGVAFYGQIDLPKFLKAHQTNTFICLLQYSGSLQDFSATFTISGENSYYHHRNSMTVDYSDVDLNDEEDNLVAGVLSNIISDIIKTTSRELELAGYLDLEAYEGKENVEEGIEANNYEFCPCGKRESDFYCQMMGCEEVA